MTVVSLGNGRRTVGLLTYYTPSDWAGFYSWGTSLAGCFGYASFYLNFSNWLRRSSTYFCRCDFSDKSASFSRFISLISSMSSSFFSYRKAAFAIHSICFAIGLCACFYLPGSTRIFITKSSSVDGFRSLPDELEDSLYESMIMEWGTVSNSYEFVLMSTLWKLKDKIFLP